MSIYKNKKCSKTELLQFKAEVLKWLNKRFDLTGLKIKAYTCYNGDIRIYTGHIEYTNKKSSFRRETANKNLDGEITGYHGYRGHFETKIPTYISINRDEFSECKKAFDNKESEEYDWWQETFRELKK